MHGGLLIRAIAGFLAGALGMLQFGGALAQNAETQLGGSRASGRVAAIYVKGADNLFMALAQAPQHLQKNAERWVDIEFPELLANEVGNARAVLGHGDAPVQVGDVLEIQFAHRDNPRYFPLREFTRVTAFVAARDQMLAREFERRILARTTPGSENPFRDMRARPHTSGLSLPPVLTAGAD